MTACSYASSLPPRLLFPALFPRFSVCALSLIFPVPRQDSARQMCKNICRAFVCSDKNLFLPFHFIDFYTNMLYWVKSFVFVVLRLGKRRGGNAVSCSTFAACAMHGMHVRALPARTLGRRDRRAGQPAFSDAGARTGTECLAADGFRRSLPRAGKARHAAAAHSLCGGGRGCRRVVALPCALPPRVPGQAQPPGLPFVAAARRTRAALPLFVT